mmetsp:Transcript_20182/g.69893  ORF Transcript_20182/g.69893 Transcript_20182/m.69893 type:complete len:273 (-) Transcript_20182:391-1209(-)
MQRDRGVLRRLEDFAEPLRRPRVGPEATHDRAAARPDRGARGAPPGSALRKWRGVDRLERVGALASRARGADQSAGDPSARDVRRIGRARGRERGPPRVCRALASLTSRHRVRPSSTPGEPRVYRPRDELGDGRAPLRSRRAYAPQARALPSHGRVAVGERCRGHRRLAPENGEARSYGRVAPPAAASGLGDFDRRLSGHLHDRGRGREARRQSEPHGVFQALQELSLDVRGACRHHDGPHVARRALRLRLRALGGRRTRGPRAALSVFRAH